MKEDRAMKRCKVSRPEICVYSEYPHNGLLVHLSIPAAAAAAPHKTFSATTAN
jgi:hypothetical protein